VIQILGVFTVWRCKIYDTVEVDWKSIDAYDVVLTSNVFLLDDERTFSKDRLFSNAIEELMREVELPSAVPLRACTDLEEGVVAVTYKPQWPDELYIALLVCNVNELLCNDWAGGPLEILAALIAGEAARRVASRHPDPIIRSRLLEVAGHAERILKPIARFILGEEVDTKELVDAMRGLAEIYEHPPVTIFETLDKLKEALGEEDFRKLRKMLEEVVKRSYLGIGPYMGFTFAYLRVSRDGGNSVLPTGAVGAILAVPLKPGYESQQHVLDAIDLVVRHYIYTFRSGEILDVAAKTMKEIPSDSHVILYVAKEFDDRIDAFRDPPREDVLRMVEAYIGAFVESYEKGSMASRTVRLGDGRKLHIIVSGEVSMDDMFKYSVLLLSNYEIKSSIPQGLHNQGFH